MKNLGVLAKEDVAQIFNSLCKIAAAGGLWSEDTAIVVSGLADAIGISVDLPRAITATTIDSVLVGEQVAEVLHVEN